MKIEVLAPDVPKRYFFLTAKLELSISMNDRVCLLTRQSASEAEELLYLF